MERELFVKGLEEGRGSRIWKRIIKRMKRNNVMPKKTVMPHVVSHGVSNGKKRMEA
jgi:hypothetical protein